MPIPCPSKPETAAVVSEGVCHDSGDAPSHVSCEGEVAMVEGGCSELVGETPPSRISYEGGWRGSGGVGGRV